MKTLVAQIFSGEFGWELFCWQGWLRKRAKSYDKCYVICRNGHEALYQDFATVKGVELGSIESNMWMSNSTFKPNISDLFPEVRQYDLIDPSTCVCRYDHTHRHNHIKPFKQFNEQIFVPYGYKTDLSSYDVIIHARNKTNKTNDGTSSVYRNWSKDNWIKFVSLLHGYKIACIGTQADAMHIDSTTDLRNLSLNELSNVLTSSKIIVGPSSGPIHFASLCKCPQITWYGNPYDDQNKVRFTKDWNPFNTYVSVERIENWNLPVELVVDKTKKFICSIL